MVYPLAKVELYPRFVPGSLLFDVSCSVKLVQGCFLFSQGFRLLVYGV